MVNQKPKLVHRQEIEVWYILPALRKAIAGHLKNLNLEQKQIASFLGITDSAVSQYFTKKRGGEVSFPASLNSQIHQSAEKIANEQSDIILEAHKLMNLKEIQHIICQIHKKNNPELKSCHICENC